VSDDAELIDQTLKGKPAAFGVLVEKYQDRLFNAVVHCVGNVEDARDAVQEAFIQAFLRLETFHQTSAFYTWLYRIAFNLAASHRRKKHQTASVDWARESTGCEPVDSGDGPAEQLAQEERRQKVREAIGQLGEDHRAVLVLRDMEGCCYEEIAEILDLPVGTVRSRLHRARGQLRDALKGSITLD
jgi:RNA polymerase sigma-70 factor, ECF subfamily